MEFKIGCNIGTNIISKRLLRFLVATGIYSFVISLLYLTLIHKPHRIVDPGNSSAPPDAQQRLRTRWTQRSDAGVVVNRSAERKFIISPVLHDEHAGYVDILTGEPLRLACSSCAVVSSSGHLLKTNSGALIDAAACVFRMNNAPVRGFESDVGTKTTIRSIAHVNLARSFEKTNAARKELLQDKETRSEYVLINWMNRVNVRKLQDREYRYAVLLAHLYPDVNFYAFNSDQMRYAEKVFREETGLSRQQANTWLSTGWFTILAAMDICDNVTVYGMAYDDYCSNQSNDTQSIPYHYYEPRGMKECAYYNVSETRLDGGHLFITEKAVFKRWARKHPLFFKYPSWHIDRNSTQPLDSPFLRRYRQLLNETNYAVNSVREYVKLEKEAKRREKAGERTVELKHGNRTFVIEKRQLIQKVLELVPGAKPISKGKDIRAERHIKEEQSTDKVRSRLPKRNRKYRDRRRQKRLLRDNRGNNIR